MIRFISDLDDSEYIGKTVFVRVDFNVTIKSGHIGEDFRIRMSVPTIDYLIKRQCKVVLASHLGRPKGKIDEKYSLRPVSVRLSEILPKTNVKFVDDCIGGNVKTAIKNLKNSEILLLENLRFHENEEYNDPEFSKQLSSYSDIYVNDAFSTSHRKHSSTYGAATLFETKLGGFNLKKEIEYLTMIKEKPQRPFTLIVGGVKIKDKIGALENLLPKADKVLVGGAAAYTFLKAKGFETGKSLIDNEHLRWVFKSLDKYGEKIFLPSDHVVSKSAESSTSNLCIGNIPKDMSGFDIGHETITEYSKHIGSNNHGTIFWNGPMGFFERDLFSNGTVQIAKSMALAYWRGSTTLVGGGDTLEAIKQSSVSESEVSHVSTGGGATLRYLAGDKMPGLIILEEEI